MNTNPWIESRSLDPKEGEVYEGRFSKAKRYARYSHAYKRVVLFDENGLLANHLGKGMTTPYRLVSPAPEVEYEEQWHLNDGSPIPENADCLKKDGAVVAYRKVKEDEGKMWGDMTREEKLKLCAALIDGENVQYLYGTEWVPKENVAFDPTYYRIVK